MQDKTLKPTLASRQRDAALSNWVNEGGAIPRHATALVPPIGSPATSMDTEWEQLHIRVIALENLVIALLAESSAPQLNRARAMAVYVAPRPGFTRHRLTTHAAAQMIHLVRRGGHFSSKAPPALGDD